jgi:mersacidin/lichenicidin family type 2 lantibiotic
MSKKDIINAWKDADLNDEEKALVPENPAGLVELTDEALDNVVGGGSCVCWSCRAAEVEQL